jgi:hypothetical protein
LKKEIDIWIWQKQMDTMKNEVKKPKIVCCNCRQEIETGKELKERVNR